MVTKALLAIGAFLFGVVVLLWAVVGLMMVAITRHEDD